MTFVGNVRWQLRYDPAPGPPDSDLYASIYQVIGNPPSLAAFFEIWRRNPGRFLGELTYKAGGDLAAAFADRLRAEGIAPGDRVLFWSENRPEWVIALWGCLLEGVIAVPVDFRSSAKVVARIAAIVTG